MLSRCTNQSSSHGKSFHERRILTLIYFVVEINTHLYCFFVFLCRVESVLLRAFSSVKTRLENRDQCIDDHTCSTRTLHLRRFNDSLFACSETSFESARIYWVPSIPWSSFWKWSLKNPMITESVCRRSPERLQFEYCAGDRPNSLSIMSVFDTTRTHIDCGVYFDSRANRRSVWKNISFSWFKYVTRLRTNMSSVYVFTTWSSFHIFS